MTPLPKTLRAFIAAAAILTAAAADYPQTLFSPRGGCSQRVVTLIESANHSIDVAAYSITPTPIVDALTAAARRGVTVRLVVDRRQPKQPSSVAPRLAAAGFPVRVDRKHSTMHAKLILIDRHLALFGSYNWTANAEKANAEILHITDHPDTVATLTRWFDQLNQL